MQQQEDIKLISAINFSSNDIINKPDINNLNPLKDLQEFAKFQSGLAKRMMKVFALPKDSLRIPLRTATEMRTKQEYKNSQHLAANAADIYAPKLMLHLGISFGEKLLKYTKGKRRRKIRRKLRKLRKQVKNEN